jgi:hypothetical protein
VNKAKLLSTVAAALLLSAGVASAQGMKRDDSGHTPAAQQNAPAEKVAPAMKGGEHTTPQRTGQAATGAKSSKKHETTGQAPKTEVEDKAPIQNHSVDKEGKTGIDGGSAAHKTGEHNDANGSSSTSGQMRSEQHRATTGQGAAAGSAKLTTEQRTKIVSVIRQRKVEPTHLNVSVAVGTRIPVSVHVYPLPVQVINVYPEWRGYDYILVGDEIVIINPHTHEIVAIVEA